ncbi:MAG TPA: hypothetical protein ENN69_03830, partial [Spirochaetia bacterium]|nr:hypothetical protein [Spirochaetia bacterium]
LRYWLIVAAGFLLVTALLFGGFSLDALSMLGVGAAAFVLTALVFHTQGKGRIVAALEIFFTGGLYLAFLNFSRSSEEIARASGGAIKILFILAVLSFFIHAVLLFLASFPRVVKGKGRRNILVFLLFLIPLGLVLSFLLPVDFITHEVEVNPLSEQPDPNRRPLNGEGRPFDFDGALRGHTPRDRDGELEGMSPENWKNLKNLRSSSRNGVSRQYALMIVATQRETLYLGNAYYGDLNRERGFLLSKEEPLNDLSTLRLIESWRNPSPGRDLMRLPVQVKVFSALEEKYFAYRPEGLSPTVLNEEEPPFIYSYEGLFAVSEAPPQMLSQAGRLPVTERLDLARYLDLPFSGETAAVFGGYVNALVEPGMSDMEKVDAIVDGYKSFQYELGFSEDVSTAHILEFLTETKTGDCTEFANTTAILARYAGVPSRVVTGFLASRELQLPKHVQGLYYLREHMEPLQAYPLSELLMVTTSHRHAWTQVYIAGYGWIDIETTATAIPPALGG